MDMELAATCVWSAAFVFAGAYVGCESRRPSIKVRKTTGMGSELATHLMALPVVQKVKELSRRSERRSVVLRELPTLLDVVTLGLSSGLSFDASLDLYCQRYDTSLAASFAESMLSWRVGVKGRAEALDDLANRLDVVALRRFAAAVTQALAFGSPLAETLDQQAQAIRDEQRSELEAEIERVPVKMLIPLGTLIVPAMLLSILGPLLGSSVAFV
ncbi:MAG: type II secretion system F family protein [Coriobacteriales bacterium]|nr:type II secretion system F family protein [Coriobacteriales bacterium]